MRVNVAPVSGLLDFLHFCSLPRKIYAGAPGFAPPLDAERWTNFARKLNPHYRLVDEQKWLARDNGRVVGRICAQVYRDLQPVGASKFQFGALDAIEDADVVRQLTQAAEAWLRAKGAETVCGPFSPTVNGECGMLVEGFEAAPMIFIPWHPPYLGALLEQAGYAKEQDLISYRYDVTSADRESPTPLQDRAKKDGLAFRSLRLDALDGELTLMREIFNDGWAENWGFVPFSAEEFKSLADGLKLIMTEDYGFFIELGGEPVAFCIVIPNLHEVAAPLNGNIFSLKAPGLIANLKKHPYKSARLALFGMRKKLHKSAKGGLIVLTLIEELRKRSRRVALDHVEFGWVLETNAGMRKPIEMSGARIDKVHRIYAKTL